MVHVIIPLLFILSGIYIGFVYMVMDIWYKPDIFLHFKEETESMMLNRTTNITAIMSSRIQKFESDAMMTAKKLAKIAKPIFTSKEKPFVPPAPPVPEKPIEIQNPEVKSDQEEIEPEDSEKEHDPINPDETSKEDLTSDISNTDKNNRRLAEFDDAED